MAWAKNRDKYFRLRYFRTVRSGRIKIDGEIYTPDDPREVEWLEGQRLMFHRYVSYRGNEPRYENYVSLWGSKRYLDATMASDMEISPFRYDVLGADGGTCICGWWHIHRLREQDKRPQGQYLRSEDGLRFVESL